MKMYKIVSKNAQPLGDDLPSLMETRQRYVRLLDALTGGDPNDEDLRKEIGAALDALDAKIAAHWI